MGRRVMLVADEDVVKLEAASPSSFLWVVDITDETRPVPFASFQVDGLDGSPQPEYTGCHQPVEEVRTTEIPVAWFAHGLRIVDIRNPHAARAARLDDYGLAPGRRADLVVLDAPSVHEALRLQPPRRHVIKDGQEVARARLSRELRKLPSGTDSRQL